MGDQETSMLAAQMTAKSGLNWFHFDLSQQSYCVLINTKKFESFEIFKTVQLEMWAVIFTYISLV